jgi:Uma2 family endonuclease
VDPGDPRGRSAADVFFRKRVVHDDPVLLENELGVLGSALDFGPSGVNSMSTITSRSRRSSTSVPPRPYDNGDQRIVIQGVDWDVYDCLSEAIGEGQHVRLAYDGEDLEIMTAGYPHERYKEMLGKIVAAVSRAKGIPRKTAGETTWKRLEIERGLQADECYYFHADKFAAVEAAFARQSMDIADYPNPDLAIEIDLSGPKVDRPGIYAKLQVAEVWRFDGESLVIEQLRDDGSYAPAETSRFLPLRAKEILRCLIEEDSGDELAWERRLEQWAKRLRRKK